MRLRGFPLRRRTWLCGGALAVWPALFAGLARGQTLATRAGTPRQLGILGTFPGPRPGGATSGDSGLALRRGLRELGWREGENLLIHQENAFGDPERYAPLAAAMLQRPVDVIVASGPYMPHLQSLKTKVPVVMGGISVDPVEQGLVHSLARPGGLFTGLSSQMLELGRKRLELLAELVPPPQKLGVLMDAGPRNSHSLQELRATAQRLGREWVEVHAPDLAHLEGALRDAARQRVGGLMVAGFLGHFAELNVVAQRHRIALMFPLRQQRAGDEPVDLISYAPDFPAIWYRAAYYVDRILRGTPPGELPVEQPTQINLIINLRTARAIGLTVPPSLLLRATRVIE